MMANDEPNYVPPNVVLVGDEHVRVYRESNGEQGYLWNGVPILLLTTTGRRSGLQRTSALIFGRDGNDLLVVASMGGAPKDPTWYANLTANPVVEVQLKDQVFRARARTADATEKPRLWKIVTDIWPNYDVYTKRTNRVIPLVVLTPEPQQA